MVTTMLYNAANGALTSLGTATALVIVLLITVTLLWKATKP